MTREKMIEELTEYCHSRPVDKCSICPIRRRLAQGFGCIRIKDRTDDQLAADMEKLPKPEPAQPKSIVMPNLEPPRIKYMVTVDRDVLRLIRGKLIMLSRCVGATINEAIGEELGEMAEVIYNEIDACDREAIMAEKAMIDALQRERENLIRAYDDMVQQNDGEPLMQEE